MPFFVGTPESNTNLGRSDSKNPNTTCRGITSSGRPCRRPITDPAAAAAAASTGRNKLRVDDPADENLYCWQHRDQASVSAHSSPGPRLSHTPILEERTSIDTLADRLGLAAGQSEKPQKHHGSTRPPKTSTQSRPKQRELRICCFRIPIDDPTPPPRPSSRPKPTPLQQQTATASIPPKASGNRPSHKPQTPSGSPSRPSRLSPSAQSSGRKSQNGSVHSTSSQTAQFLSLIPPSTDPQTASRLMAELAKPVSQQDEAGYIYMFWLTPESQAATPPAEAARSLLSPPSPTPRSGGGRDRSPSDVLASFARAADATRSRGLGGSDAGVKKILLKIGRANNVHRRLNEWQRQCGYNLSLVRYYPYISSDSPAVPRKMPHSHKVERMIHLELAGLGLRVADREKCETCGREHREWFEVTATTQAVKNVDEVIRRWVEWDEAQG